LDDRLRLGRLRERVQVDLVLLGLDRLDVALVGDGIDATSDSPTDAMSSNVRPGRR